MIMNSPTFSTFPKGTSKVSPFFLAPLTLTFRPLSTLITTSVILPVFPLMISSPSLPL